MKKILIPVLTATLLAGCGKQLDDFIIISKDINYEYQADVPVIPNRGPFPAQGLTVPFPKYTVVTNAQAFLKENNTNSEKISSVKAKALELSVLQPANGYLDYIDTLRVYVSGDNLPEKLAAYKYGIIGLQKSINLTTEDIELREYFLKDSMYFRVTAHFRDYPAANSKVNLKTVMHVEAKPIK